MSSPSNHSAIKDMAGMQQAIREKGEDGWDETWQSNFTPWDAGQPQPGLEDAVAILKESLPKSGRALIPGCGRGYDVEYLASALHWTVIGMDISKVAIEAARSFAGLSDRKQGEVVFEELSFFEQTTATAGQFDIIYDYTFFCAIPISKRKEWGVKVGELIKPGGHVIAMAWPIVEPSEVGPPFPLSVEAYAEALGPKFEKIVEKIPEKTISKQFGDRKLIVWKYVG